MQLDDWLDDLCVRFIINLPQEELGSVERICFQVEEAQWYYEDFIRPLDPDLPSLNLRNFCLRIFQHCPLLSEFSPYHHAAAFEEFLAYKTRVPVRGAIMLNDEMDEVILVKGWKKGANWSFPRGKINKDESDLACAVREVYEETGYDVEAAGLVALPDTMKYIDVAIQHQHIRLYVFRGVPMDTPFEARTRKEISKIEWWKLSDLPTLKKKKQQQEGRGEDLAVNANKFYMVAPFLVPLKKWISQQKRMEKSRSTDLPQHPVENDVEELLSEGNALNGTAAGLASHDMERLLAGLRQPARISTISNAQILSTRASADEASSQLKNLLRVPTMDQVATEVQTTRPVPTENTSTSAEEKRASTLLALLRGGPSTQKAPGPQTPMDQVALPPSVPKSPKPHHMVQPRISTHTPPPAFPLSPDNFRKGRPDQLSQLNAEPIGSCPVDTQEASIAAWNNFETTSAEQEAARRKVLAEEHAARLAEEEKTGAQYEPAMPVMNETWRQVKVDKNTNMRRAGQREVSNILKRSVGGHPQSQQTQNGQPTRQQQALDVTSNPAPVPYQATTNVQVAANLQYPDIYRPVIPAANKLPMPKLTAHSSSLLNLFKGDQPTKAAQGASMSSLPDSSVPSQPRAAAAGYTKEQGPLRSALDEIPTLDAGSPKAPSPRLQKAAEPKRPQSAHQAALLDLFRKPSTSATESRPATKATLDVPADLVELSAMPSPGHSREPSKAEVEELQKVHSSISSEPYPVQKRPQVNAKHGKPAVFATVSGPLNVPQFEMIANKAKKSSQKPAAAKEIKKSPVTILARPASAKAKSSSNELGASKPDGPRANGPAIPPPIGLNPDLHKPPTPKQILRRPLQAEKPATQSEPPILPPVQPPAPKRETPSPLAASDRRPSYNPDHKATLLSLFTKSSSPITSPGFPSRPDLSAFVSPIAVKPPSFFPAPSKDTNKSDIATSGLSDMVNPSSANGNAISRDGAVDGEVRPASRKMTSDVDRDFLLGYLEGVARSEGK
ncbi:MAG: hypothetical protein Q9225_004933 [Loekoesia sp. 1 TL-2023]